MVDMAAASDYRTFYAEDLEKKKEDLMRMSVDERFIFIMSILTQVLPRRNEVVVSSKVHTPSHTASVNKSQRQLQPSDDIGRSAAEVERERAIVVAGLPEPDPGLRGQEMSSFEWRNIWDLLGELDISCQPAFAYRLGVLKQGVPRLLKIVFPASVFQRTALRNARRLRDSAKFRNVYVRPSLTAEERRIAFALRQQRRHLRESTGGSYRVVSNGIFDIKNNKTIPLDPKFLPPLQNRHRSRDPVSSENVTIRKKVVHENCAEKEAVVNRNQNCTERQNPCSSDEGVRMLELNGVDRAVVAALQGNTLPLN
ncbi:hypothetical protein Y032_0007g3543 [Ancylostoma ceylanicum]|uniref:Uncharacterized protein n=1 Tax=Ancylostoma ceylanicum TaxID=53326 RepID=A0A016VN57_9BILA|nr:hypothetical protein Y032_0007g3543 [Ancylostoma ceylanicum]